MILKMGEQYHFFIDNGRQCYEFDFSKHSFNGSENKIPAKE